MKKQVVMEVCTVALDGMPRESHENVMVYFGYGAMVVPYSHVHRAFNCRDELQYDGNEAQRRVDVFKDVTHYAVIPSVREIFEGR